MFTILPLPFEKTALEPYISAKTMEYHYGQHHQAYVNKLNKLIIGTELEEESLESIMMKTKDNLKQVAIFNNASQIFNHQFFWNSLHPSNKEMKISEELLSLLNNSFGSFDNFVNDLKTTALSQFGSGWVWLVKNNKTLEIMKTANADTPLAHHLRPVLTIDLWEHAYYLDYQNRRAEFLEVVIAKLLNWDFASQNLLN